MKVILALGLILAFESSPAVSQSCLGWGWTDSSSPLGNAFEFGSDHNSEKAYSCQVSNGGGIVPGQFTQSTGRCRIIVNGQEQVVTSGIKVLTNQGANLHFQPSSTGGIPEWSNPIVGGNTASGENLYLIRCTVSVGGQSGWIAGRYQESTGLSQGTVNGQVVNCPTGGVQFLVCS